MTRASSPTEPQATESQEPVETPDLSQFVTEMEIDLSFEVGRSTMSVADLRTIQAGYVFQLETDLDRPVTIKANGRPVGRGRLVRVGDRIAVQTTEIGKHED